MSAVFSKAQIESKIADRFGDAFRIGGKTSPTSMLATGIDELDALIGGFPRGGISEIHGRVSSGRTSLIFSLLAHATTHEEICALVDTSDSFAPVAAAKAGIDFERMLWVRCATNIEHAFKATDLLLHAGGFGVVILDMGDVPGKEARRIISSWWYRFRRTVENKPTAIVVVTEEPCTGSCAMLSLELEGAAKWSNTVADPNGSQRTNVLPINKHISASGNLITQANLLRVNAIKINRRRPITASVNEMQFSAMSHF